LTGVNLTVEGHDWHPVAVKVAVFDFCMAKYFTRASEPLRRESVSRISIALGAQLWKCELGRTRNRGQELASCKVAE